MGKLKFNIGDRIIGNDKKASFRDRRGRVIKHGPGKSEYCVRFDDGREEYVQSWWLDREESTLAEIKEPQP